MNCRNRAILVWLVAPALLIALLVAVAWSLAERAALSALEARGVAVMTLRAEALSGWLGRFQPLASIYAHDPDVVRLMRGGAEDPAQLARVNRRLKEWTDVTGAADTYLLNADGVAIAASNWDRSWSYVGNDYSYRPYYTLAIVGGEGRYFALGTSSGRRGYYFSYPIHDGLAEVGVVVVKVSVDAVEQDLGNTGDAVFIADGSGVIVLAGRREWRLKTLGPLSKEALAVIRAQRQYDVAALAPVRFSEGSPAAGPPGRFVAVGQKRREMLHLTRPLPVEGWTLHLLIPTADARAEAMAAAALVGAVAVAGVLTLFIAVQRRRRLLERIRERERARQRMERAVEERTADLRLSNERLAREVEERRAAEERLRTTQRELVQAGKLAALGQMSTSLSHEFNQPLAAIRAYADNATAFLNLGRIDEVADNLERISGLTQRMADLSRNLTRFARKPEDAAETVDLAPVIQQAIDLLQGRLQRLGVSIKVDCPPGAAAVGGRTRLQQVFVNVIGNAIDACAGAAAPAIRVAVETAGDKVAIAVSDNGPGVAEDLQERIFDPFFTTKQAGEGLGLGLSISFNIIRDFGGALSVETSREGGACFRISLRRATVMAEA